VLLLIVRCRCERALEKERTFFATTNYWEGGSSAKPSPNPLPEGEGYEKPSAEQILDASTMLMLSQSLALCLPLFAASQLVE
jgi:hypothetical protein